MIHSPLGKLFLLCKAGLIGTKPWHALSGNTDFSGTGGDQPVPDGPLRKPGQPLAQRKRDQ